MATSRWNCVIRKRKQATLPIYDAAVHKLARLHEEDPDDADVLNLLGYGYPNIGEHTDVEKFIDKYQADKGIR